MLLGMVLGLNFGALAQTRTITLSSGSGAFPKPYQTNLQVSIWGAGGGGGYTGDSQGAGGGGGGAFTQITSYTFGVGFASANYVVGVGGPGQSNSNLSVGNGGQSSFGHTGNLFISNGGTGANGFTRGLGGTASPIGDIRNAGGNSTNGPGTNNSGGSGGGGAGGIISNGGQGLNSATGGAGGSGGGSGSGSGGAGGTGSNPGANGNNGITFGGGGGGEGRSSNLAGNGANGQITLVWSCSNTLVSGTPNPSAVCLGTDFGPVIYDLIGASGYTLDWIINGSASASPPSGVNVTNVDGRITISGASTVSGVFSYSLTPTYPTVGITTGSCAGSASFSGSFTVTPSNTAGTISSTTFCQNSALPTGVTQSTTGATGIGAPSNLPPGITANWAGNQITFSGTPTTPGSYNYSIPLTGGCGAINATGTITINEVPAIKTPVLPGDTKCLNVAFSAISVGTGSGYTYQWYSNDTQDYTTPNLISGATSNSYTPLTSAVGTLYYYVVVSSPSCSAVTSAVSSAYIVTPSNTVTAASSTPAVCITSPLSDPITHDIGGATGIGAITWSPSNPGGMTVNFASNKISIDGTPTASGVFTYSVPLTGGCGTVNATGTLTVNAQAAIISANLSPGGQTRCINAAAFNPISVGAGTGFTYKWYSKNTAENFGGTLIPGATSNSYTPLNNAEGSTYYYVEVSSSGSCGSTVTSAASGEFKVNPLPAVSFTDQPVGPNICVDTDVTYETQMGQSNYVWIIPGALNVDYTITSGGHSGSRFVVLKWLTTGTKAVSVNYSDANSCGATTPATSNTVNVIKNTVTAASNPHPSSCYTGAFTSITHTTSLATGIGPPVGLPLGLTASWAGTAVSGTIIISGTVDPSVTPGIKNYTIPLTGGCGTVAATGIIDVQPNYQLSKITSVSPSIVGGTATITIEGDPSIFTNGSYQVTYSLGLSNAGSETKTVSFNNGKAIFSSLPITSEDLTSLSISQIKKATDDCFVPSVVNNITFFGIKAATFTTNSTFYVPAGIHEITIKVWGGGGGGGNGSNGAGGGGGGYSTQTIGVFPGEEIEIVIGAGGNAQTGGGASYATRDSTHPNPIASSLVYAYGGGAANGQTPGTGGSGTSAAGGNGASGNGLSGNAQIGGKGGNGGGITGGQGGLGGAGNGNRLGNDGEIPGGAGGGGKGANGGEGGNGLVLISYPLPPVGPCFRVIDDGSISSMTIIEFTCDNTWTAPLGLLEFDTYVGGAGGGGGAGSGAGGGGAGALASGTIQSGSPYGFAANTTFNIRAGEGGEGAQTNLVRGFRGRFSSIAGIVGGTPIIITAEGGGGGGSEFSILGESGINGSNGGGGGANNTAEGDGGIGSGRAGGKGDYSEDQAFAGGGGAGVAEVGAEGKGAGLGQGEGGKGGNGVAITMGDTTRYFGAGGGGVGFNFLGTQKIGHGGTAPNGTKIGGDGNLTGVNPAGMQGVDKTGSGGGAGYGRGGKGGNGVVYITYFNYSILEVDYQYFNAIYNHQIRSGELTWATSKEWDNSHFEIERAANNVKTWTKIGVVNGQGYSDTTVDYNFTDTELPAAGGNIFYRLKQVDFDGSFSYSVTKSIQVEALEGTATWIAYPNPSDMGSAVAVALLDDSGYTDGTVQIRISDVRGIFQTYTVQNPEDVSAAVNSYLENARPGLYIVQLFWGNKSEQLKLIRK